MKSLTIQLPDELAARIEAEAVERKMSISDVIRKHLSFAHSHNPRRDLFEAITDVVRSAVAEPSPRAGRSPDRALFDAITDVVRSAEQLIDAERLPHSDPLPESERSPDADPLPDADALPDDPSTRTKGASHGAKRSESAP
jgi:hypothetical protein